MKEYFSHDLNARNDRKMVSLAMVHGMAGVGVYWSIVEMLYEEQGRLMRSECERIAFELRTQCDIIESVIADFDLFQCDEKWFWSTSVIRRIEAQLKVASGAKKAAEIRWQKFKNQPVVIRNATTDASAMRTHSERNANKEKKRKEKESIINIYSDANSSDSFFEKIIATGSQKYQREMLEEFFNYWSEKNEKGKMRWQLEKTFEIANRLVTWSKNQTKWQRPQAGSGPAKNSMGAARNNFTKALEIIINEQANSE